MIIITYLLRLLTSMLLNATQVPNSIPMKQQEFIDEYKAKKITTVSTFFFPDYIQFNLMSSMDKGITDLFIYDQIHHLKMHIDMPAMHLNTMTNKLYHEVLKDTGNLRHRIDVDKIHSTLEVLNQRIPIKKCYGTEIETALKDKNSVWKKQFRKILEHVTKSKNLMTINSYDTKGNEKASGLFYFQLESTEGLKCKSEILTAVSQPNKKFEFGVFTRTYKPDIKSRAVIIIMRVLVLIIVGIVVAILVKRLRKRRMTKKEDSLSQQKDKDVPDAGKRQK